MTTNVEVFANDRLVITVSNDDRREAWLAARMYGIQGLADTSEPDESEADTTIRIAEKMPVVVDPDEPDWSGEWQSPICPREGCDWVGDLVLDQDDNEYRRHLEEDHGVKT